MRVKYSNKGKASGEMLDQILSETGYIGDTIIWGRANNKRRSLIKMREAGIPTPPFYSSYTGVKLIGRTDHHMHGNRMYIINSEKDFAVATFSGATHFMEFMGVEREFRVHVVDGVPIKVSEKFPPGNHTTGSKFKSAHTRHMSTLHKLAVEACEVLGYDIGAVDIIYSKNGGFYVLEVNTAPCLTASESTLRAYTEALMNRNKVMPRLGLWDKLNPF